MESTMTSGSEGTHPLQLPSVRAVTCQCAVRAERGRLSPLLDESECAGQNRGERQSLVVLLVVVSCSCERKGKLEHLLPLTCL